jgi:short-subunit dehydrogenase
VIVADLADGAAAGAIVAQVAQLGMAVTLLVNNAGFGTSGFFETLPAERERDEIAVNVASVVALTHAFLPGMLERKTGGVINVASTAAFQPVPYMAVYGATKAFVRSFSEALHEEVHTRGVRVLALCPGVTSTEFFSSGVQAVQGPVRTARAVVMTALTAYNADAALVVDGGVNAAVVTLSGLFPSSWKAKIAARIMKPK